MAQQEFCFLGILFVSAACENTLTSHKNLSWNMVVMNHTSKMHSCKFGATSRKREFVVNPVGGQENLSMVQI